MPEPIELNHKVASLRISKRERHSLYHCVCWKCRGTVTVSASSIHRKRVNCRRCFPDLGGARPVVVYDRGLPSVAA
jgi:hypothetical protein